MKTFSMGVVIACMALISCDQGTLPSHNLGRFIYQAYDSLGVRVAEGWLEIDGQDSSSLGGTWHIEAVGTPSRIGPQIGDGALSGLFANGQLMVHLNPDYVDNNVDLVGTYTGGIFEGFWTYSGFPGVINSGRFTAVRLAN
jgi:hypothetical protein